MSVTVQPDDIMLATQESIGSAGPDPFADYLYCMVLPLEVKGTTKEALDEKYMKILVQMQKFHLQYKVLKSRDNDEYFVLLKGGRPFNKPDGTSVSFFDYYADLMKPAYKLRERQPGKYEHGNFTTDSVLNWEDWYKKLFESEVKAFRGERADDAEDDPPQMFRNFHLKFEESKRQMYVFEGEHNLLSEMKREDPERFKGILENDLHYRRYCARLFELEERGESPDFQDGYAEQGATSKGYKDWMEKQVLMNTMRATHRRQGIIKHVLEVAFEHFATPKTVGQTIGGVKIEVGPIDESSFRNSKDQKKLKHLLGIRGMLRNGAVSACFPLHERDSAIWLRDNWSGKSELFAYRDVGMKNWLLANLPLDHVRSYLGEQIGFYFAWLSFYTKWLIFPAIVGLICFIGNFAVAPDTLDSFFVPIYCVILGLWVTLFMEAWKRRSAVLAHEWGVSNLAEVEPPRIEFDGEFEKNRYTGDVEEVPSKKDARLYYFVSLPSVIFFICVVVAFALSVLLFKATIQGAVDDDIWRAASISVITLGGMITLNQVYGRIAEKLTDMENHMTNSEYNDSLVGKLFLFQVINMYMTLFWLAFAVPCVPFLPNMNRSIFGNDLMTLMAGYMPEPLLQTGGLFGLFNATSGTWNNGTVGANTFNHKKISEAFKGLCHCTGMSGDLDTLKPLKAFTGSEAAFGYLPPYDIVNKAMGTPNAAAYDGVHEIPLNGSFPYMHFTEYSDEKSKFIPGKGGVYAYPGTCECGWKFQPECVTNPEVALLGQVPSTQTALLQMFVQLLVVFIGKMIIINNMMEMLLPRISKKVKLYLEARKLQKQNSDGAGKIPELSRIGDEAKRSEYSIFADYNEMALQFGYVTLFAAACPIAAFFAWVNNVLEMRIDSFKILSDTRRPEFRQSEGIGTWLTVLEALGYFSIVTNSLMLGLSSSVLPKMLFQLEEVNYPDLRYKVLWAMVFFEHILFLIKFMFGQVVPDVPSWVSDERNGQSKYFEKLAVPDDDDDSGEPQQGGRRGSISGLDMDAIVLQLSAAENESLYPMEKENEGMTPGQV